MRRYINSFIGIIFFVIAMIGVVLPILPTTPILLLSAIFFARGSKRVDNWFKGTKIYQKHLADFIINREMELKSKLYTCLIATTIMMFPFFRLESIWAKAVIIGSLLFEYYYFIFKIKTKSNNQKSS